MQLDELSQMRYDTTLARFCGRISFVVTIKFRPVQYLLKVLVSKVSAKLHEVHQWIELIELHLLKWVSEMARSRIRIGRWFSKSSICYHRENVIFFVFLGSVIELLIERFKKLMEQEELAMARDSGLVAWALV